MAEVAEGEVVDAEGDEMTDIYKEMVAILNANNIRDMLGWMAAHGQSVDLNYGEDNQMWELSWISGGKRFTAVRKEIVDAIRDVIGKARTDYLERFGE